MALDPSTAPSLTSFKLLSFDIFSTLIDEFAGVAEALQPLLSQLPATHPAALAFSNNRDFAERQVSRITTALAAKHQSTPFTSFLATAYTQLADEWGVEARDGAAEEFAQSMGAWPPFADTIAAMNALGKRYKLVAVTNTTNAIAARLVAGPLKEMKWDALYTGEEIGGYKPNPKNFEYLFEHVKAEFGVEKGEVLHVANGLLSDHGPAKDLGFASAYIARRRPEGEKGYDGLPEEVAKRVRFGWRWGSMGDMAKDVEEEFARQGS